VVGETIIDMKARLYFTHKATEKLFEGPRAADGVALAERVSGRHHHRACARLLPGRRGRRRRHRADPRARWLRLVLLELEALYNHVGDVGMILNEPASPSFPRPLLPHSRAAAAPEQARSPQSPAARRGNRRGVGRDAPAGVDVAAEVDAALRDFDEMVAISLDNTLVADRLDTRGRLTRAPRATTGVLGLVAAPPASTPRAPRPSIRRVRRHRAGVIVNDAGDCARARSCAWRRRASRRD